MLFKDNLEIGIRDKEGRKRRLTKREIAILSPVWDHFDNCRTNFALECTRTNYNELVVAGQQVVEIQEKHRVWLIHPVNVGPGLKEDDPRIEER